jgi:chaperone modulatory protein CbpM
LTLETHKIFHARGANNNTVLDQWVEAGWLTPHQNFTGQRFSDIDRARARLIGDLQDLGVNDDSMPIILDLIDQLNGLRHVLRELLLTIKARQQGD